jgi:hypothetical protein
LGDNPRVRRAIALLGLLGAGCPSLDGFSGKQVQTQVDSGTTGSYLSLEDAARFCSNAFKCQYLPDSTRASLLVPVDLSSYSACVDWFAAPLPPNRPGVQQQSKALTCAAQATSCPAAAACMLMEFIGPNDPRCQAGDGGVVDGCSANGASVYRCNSGTILHCDNPYYYPGSSCLVNDIDEYWCAVAGTCTGSARCKNGSLTYCGASGQTFGIDCAVLGQKCGVEQSSGSTECLVDGVVPTCTPNGLSCVKDHVRICRSTYADYDCVALGGTCASTPEPHCTRPTDQCASSNPEINVCAGDKISLCVAGQKRELDCASIGLKCAASSGTARCE